MLPGYLDEISTRPLFSDRMSYVNIFRTASSEGKTRQHHDLELDLEHRFFYNRDYRFDHPDSDGILYPGEP